MKKLMLMFVLLLPGLVQPVEAKPHSATCVTDRDHDGHDKNCFDSDFDGR